MKDAPEALVRHAVANAALAGVQLDEAWQAKLLEVAAGTRSADDLVAEEVRRQRWRDIYAC